MSLVDSGLVNIESETERDMDRVHLVDEVLPPSDQQESNTDQAATPAVNEALSGEKSWTDRLQECVTDDGLVDGKLDSFVSLISEACSTQQDDQLLAPLLLADTEAMKALVLQHGIMAQFEPWLQRTQTNDRVLVLVLKLIERFLKRVPEVFHHLSTPLIEHLKELKNVDNPASAASAHHAITAIRYFLAENADPELNPLRDAVHEKQRRVISDDEDQDSEANTPAKRVAPLDSSLLDTPYPGNKPFPSEEPTSETPVSKSGKPKKKVRWVADEEYQVKEFFKEHPIIKGADTEIPVNPLSLIPWTLYKMDFRGNTPLLVTSTQRAHSSEPTRAYLAEMERQKTESIVLYFNDSDIPPNPTDLSSQQDRSTFAAHSAMPVHVPFTSRLPALSHVQLSHVPPGPPEPKDPSHEQYYASSAQNGQQSGGYRAPTYGAPASYSSAPPPAYDPYAPQSATNSHARPGTMPQQNHSYAPQNNYAPAPYSAPSYPHHQPPSHNMPYAAQPMPNQPAYDSYNRSPAYSPPSSAYAPHALQQQPPPSYAHHTQLPPSYNPPAGAFDHKKRSNDVIDMSEVHPTQFIFSRLKSPEDRARFVCRQWRTSGGSCEYGAHCKFLHPKDLSRF